MVQGRPHSGITLSSGTYQYDIASVKNGCAASCFIFLVDVFDLKKLKMTTKREHGETKVGAHFNI